jgi:hypothetical protein
MNASTLTAAGALAPPRAATDFELDLGQADLPAARSWLLLGLLALIGSGLFSILLVLSRTPGLNSWPPLADFFRLALVVHVDLSVLVWFVAMAGMLWSVNAGPGGKTLHRVALPLALAGTLAMLLAPFLGGGEAVMANYIPLVDNTTFLTGLGLFGAAAVLLVLRGLARTLSLLTEPMSGATTLRLGLLASQVATAVALLAFALSLLLTPTTLDSRTYYELLFWGGGHALQFTWTLLMLVAWLWLASASGAPTPLTPRLAGLLFLLALLAVFATPYAYVAHPVTSVEHRHVHTWAMRVGGGLAIAPVALAVLAGLYQARSSLRRWSIRRDAQPALLACLASSMLLFAGGGLIGMAIRGSNVTIPAHYHGCIVGVTLALMGLVYLLLPRLGYRSPQPRLAFWQPLLYGFGQLLHITGLVWSGGYGVQRKVAGAEQALRSGSEVAAMGLMGLGGLIAIIGGLLFVVIVLRAIGRQPA